ncbi:MAG: GntR family transcriptional regulator [Treponema sp.]|jgi:GntR family transcriptional repressor for pyruvate dehydrogenase complex|nr:GntR family transcriptional regulator [Treponema sp.]
MPQPRMNFTSIRKKEKVTDLVLVQIKESIMRGELVPGDRLPGASDLAGKLGVGISSVREAVKMLESMGAVESRQGEGTFICDACHEGAANAFEIQLMLLPRTAEHLVQFREMFETAYTHLAMRAAAPEDLEKVEAVVLGQEAKAEGQPPGASTTAQDEMDFHRSVLHCTHNPYVIKIGEVSLKLLFDVLQDRLAPLSIACAARDHREILEALRAKDPGRLDRVFKRSFPNWFARLRNGGGRRGGV